MKTSPAATVVLLLTTSLLTAASTGINAQPPQEGARLGACRFISCAAGPSTQWAADVPIPMWVRTAVQDCGPGSLTYAWDFGDGTAPSSEQDPWHTYAAGTWTWTAIVTAPDGEQCMKSGSVIALDGYMTRFVPIPERGPSPLTVTFHPLLHDGMCPDTPFTWDFGDGTTSTETDPTHTFTYGGPDPSKSFFVSMTEWWPSGPGLPCSSIDPYSLYVTVYNPCTFDTCQAEVPEDGFTGVPVDFKAVLSEGCPVPPTVTWDFGDDHYADTVNASHTFYQAGTYTWVMDARVPGYLASCVRTGQIVIGSCELDCATTVPLATPKEVPVSFQAEVHTECPQDHNAYFWNFGDGGTSTEPNPDHAYALAGKYEWTLMVTNGSGTCEKKGTIQVGCVQVGNLVFCADTITGAGSSYSLSGNVNLSGVLQFQGSVSLALDGADAPTGRLSTAGDISVPLRLVTERLFKGPQEMVFDVDGIAGTLSPNMAADQAMASTLAGIPLYAAGTEVALAGDRVTVKPIFYVGIAGIFTLASAEATLVYTVGGDKTLTSVEIVQGQVTPSLQFMNIQATYDPEGDKLEGTLSVGLPFLDVFGLEGAIRVQAGCFNGFDVVYSLTTEVPIPGTGVSLVGFSFRADNICKWQDYSLAFGGDVAITGFPDEVLVMSDMGFLYHSPRRFKIMAGTLKFLGYPLSSISGSLSLNRGQTGASLRGYTDLADIYQSHLDGVLSVSRVFLGGSASGTLKIPDFSCHWVNVPCRTFRRLLTAAVTLPYTVNDFGTQFGLSGRTGTWNGSLRGRIRLASIAFGYLDMAAQLEFRQGEGIKLFLGTDYDNLYETRAGEQVLTGPESSEQAVTLDAPQALVFFAAAGEADIPAAFLRTPAGQTVTPSNVGSFPGMVYLPGDDATKVAVFQVENAAAGTWTVGAENLAAGQVTFAALVPVPPPQASFTSVQQSGDTVSISLAVNPPSSTTAVNLFFSTDGAAQAGEPVALDLPATSGTVATTWDLSSLASGSYFLFATVEDGKNPPVIARHTEPIAVVHGSLAAPTALSGVRTGDRADLTWTPSSSPSAKGYNLLYTDSPEVPGTKFSQACIQSDRAAVEGLAWDESYRFVVQAFDAEGNFSPESASFTLQPAPTVPGDCDGSGAVSIGEVQKAINMFLGSIPPDCSVDCNGDGVVSIGEVQKVINAFLGVASSC